MVTRWIKLEDEELKLDPGYRREFAFAMKGATGRKCAMAGVKITIAKPISIASFLQTVERFLS